MGIVLEGKTAEKLFMKSFIFALFCACFPLTSSAAEPCPVTSSQTHGLTELHTKLTCTPRKKSHSAEGLLKDSSVMKKIEALCDRDAVTALLDSSVSLISCVRRELSNAYWGSEACAALVKNSSFSQREYQAVTTALAQKMSQEMQQVVQHQIANFSSTSDCHKINETLYLSFVVAGEHKELLSKDPFFFYDRRNEFGQWGAELCKQFQANSSKADLGKIIQSRLDPQF